MGLGEHMFVCRRRGREEKVPTCELKSQRKTELVLSTWRSQFPKVSEYTATFIPSPLLILCHSRDTYHYLEILNEGNETWGRSLGHGTGLSCPGFTNFPSVVLRPVLSLRLTLV